MRNKKTIKKNGKLVKENVIRNARNAFAGPYLK
jgi:hypothetical protein